VFYGQQFYRTFADSKLMRHSAIGVEIYFTNITIWNAIVLFHWVRDGEGKIKWKITFEIKCY